MAIFLNSSFREIWSTTVAKQDFTQEMEVAEI